MNYKKSERKKHQESFQLKKSKSGQISQKKEIKKDKIIDLKKALEDFLKKRNRTLMWLCKHYPKCFSIERPAPLKIGIIRDIYEIIPEAISRTIVRKVLQRYTRTKRYLDALISNPYRYNLEGERVGDVSDKERYVAQKAIDSFKNRDRVGQAPSS